MPICKTCAKDMPPGGETEFRIEVQFVCSAPKCETCKTHPTERTWADFCSVKCLVEYASTTSFEEEVRRVTK